MRPKLRLILVGRYAGIGWGLVLGLLVAFLMSRGLLNRFSLVAYDLRARLDRPTHLPETPQIALIGINASDIKNPLLGPTPWPRTRYAELLRYLAKAEARVVAFDMFFDLADAQGAKNDDEFAAAIRKHGRVVLATFSSTPQDSLRRDPARGAYRGDLVKNIDKLNSAAAAIGHLNVFYDRDGIARRVPVAIGSRDGQEMYAPLAVEVARWAAKGLALSPPLLIQPLVRWRGRIPVDDQDCIVVRLLNEGYIHLREPGTVDVGWLEKLAEQKPIRMYSFLEVAAANPKRLPPSEFKDKIVLVGETIQGSEQDVHSTAHGRRFGALIQAMLLHSLLAQRPIYPLHDRYLMPSVVLFSVILGALLFKARFRGSNYVLIVGGALALVAASALLVWLNVAVFRGWGLDFDIVPFILVVIGAIGGATAANLSRATQEIERRDMALDALLEMGKLLAASGASGMTKSRLLHASHADAEVGVALAPSQRTLEQLLQPLDRLVQCEMYALYLSDSSENGHLALAASRGRLQAVGSSGNGQTPDPLDQVAALANAWLVEHQEPFLVEDFASARMFETVPRVTRTTLRDIIRSLVGIPLLTRGRTVGTLVFYNKMPSKISPTDRFSAEDLRLIAAYAHPTAVALENAVLYKDMRGIFLDYVKSIAAAVDAKDRYTHGHSQRVALYSVGIGKELGLSSTDIELIELSATLHDVGKIAVHNQVLNKAGKLTDEEWKELRSHPSAGAAIVEKMTRLRALVPGLRNHHERFDGAGYPDRLAGDAIPLLARIIAVADAYDAMTSTRIYRESLTFQDAHMEIRRHSGTQFDPHIADAFLTYLQKSSPGFTPQDTQKAEVSATRT